MNRLCRAFAALQTYIQLCRGAFRFAKKSALIKEQIISALKEAEA